MTNGASVLSDHDTASIAVYLENDLKDTKRLDFDIFVQAVFGLSPQTIKDWSLRIREQNWLEDPAIEKSLRDYCSETFEPDRYLPTETLVNRIIELARGSLPGIPHTYPIDDICLRHNDPICIQTIPEHGPLGAKRKPDLVMIRAANANLLQRREGSRSAAPGIRWSHNLASWELKAKMNMTADLRKILNERRRTGVGGSSSSHELGALPTRRKRRSADDLEEPVRKPAPPERSTSSDKPPADTNGVTKEAKIQAGAYALETLACTYGTRLFCINLVLDDDWINLWYYDACGTVRTKNNISLIHDFDKAAAVIAGIASCSPERLGALPSFIQPPSSASYPTSWPPENLKDHTLTLEGVPGEKKATITLKEPVFTQYSLIGRRTFVYTVEPNRDISDQEMIVKVSYQANTRAREQDLVTTARAAGVGHLPDIHLAGDLWKMSDGVRRIFCDQGGIEYEDRTLRMIVYSKYFPLQMLVPQHPECIRDMATQLIGCLHDLKEKANILHRDISINNVMYELRGGVPYFVLIDYDMAVILTTEENERRKPTSKYREGTLPFMAVDLLRNPSMPEPDRIPHALRHDYESVFWLSLWSPAVLMEATTEQEKEAKDRNVAVVRAWETRDFESIANSKNNIRRRTLKFSKITLLGKAASLGHWYLQWCKIWRAVDKALDDADFAIHSAELNGLPLPSFDFETVGGLLTRDSILAALNGNPDLEVPVVSSHVSVDLLDAWAENNGGLDRRAALLSHVFPDTRGGRPNRAAARRTDPTKNPLIITQGSRNAAGTVKRKASKKKAGKATRTPPLTNPPKRKNRPSTQAKEQAVKAAKKTTVKKAATAVKTKANAATAKSSVTASARNDCPPLTDTEDEEPETVRDVVEHGYALRSRKATTREAPEQKAEKVVRKTSPANSGGRRKKPSTPVNVAAVKAAAKRTTVKKAAAKKTATTEIVSTTAATRKRGKAVAKTGSDVATKTAVTKKATPKPKGEQGSKSAPANCADVTNDAGVLQPLDVDLGENDIRRRLRPRKRT